MFLRAAHMRFGLLYSSSSTSSAVFLFSRSFSDTPVSIQKLFDERNAIGRAVKVRHPLPAYFLYKLWAKS